MKDEQYEHKKIFFLRPRDAQLMDLLRKLKGCGYEVHEIPSLTIMEDILRRFKNAFLFINLDDTIISEECWLYTIGGLKKRAEFKNIKVGIFHYTKDYLSRSLLLNIGVDLGMIKLSRNKDKLHNNFRLLLAALQANEALGRRKSIRISLPEKKYKVGIRSEGQIVTGNVIDMSYMGIACSFPYTELLQEKKPVDDIIIKCENTVFNNLSGKCLPPRDNKTVIVFNQNKISVPVLKKINTHIQTFFHNDFKEEVNKITYLEDNAFHLES